MAVDVPIVGDARWVLSSLLAELKKHELAADRHLPDEQIGEWKRCHLMLREDPGGEIMPEQVVRRLWEITKGEAVVATEVGQNQMWAAQYYLAATRGSSSLPGVWVPWGSAFPRPSGPKWHGPTLWSSTLPETVPSR